MRKRKGGSLTTPWKIINKKYPDYDAKHGRIFKSEFEAENALAIMLSGFPDMKETLSVIEVEK